MPSCPNVLALSLAEVRLYSSGVEESRFSKGWWHGFLIMLLFAISSTIAQGGMMSFNGFENPPYSTGGVNGQDGWIVTGSVSAADIVTSGPDHGEPPLSGAQSLYMKGSGFARQNLTTQDFFDGLSLKWRQQITGGDWNTTGLNNTLSGGQTYMQIEFDSGGSILAYNASGTVTIGSYTLGDIYDVTVTFNFTNNTYSVTLNDITTASNSTTSGISFVSPTTTANAGGQLILRMRSGGMYDDVKFVPEPSTIMLTSLGLLSTFVLRRRQGQRSMR